MRIGLLVCDHVATRYLAIDGDYTDMFTAMVAGTGAPAEVVHYDAVAGVLPERPDECDGWLCTGSSASVYDGDAWIEALAGFVREVHATKVPFAGVCFGHQLVAHALGGRTERAMGGWGAGALPMEVTAEEPWMTPTRSSATLLYSHQDQVTVLPPGGRVLASAAHCPIAMLAVDDHVVGVQAHPEFSAAYLRALLEDRVDRIGEAGTVAALRSLEHPTDEQAVAAWLVTFLRDRAAREG